MDSKLEKLLNHIGINEDNMQYFNNSYVNKVVVDKNDNTLNFIITMDSIPNINVYDDVLNCLNHEFSSKIRLEFDCQKEKYTNIEELWNNKMPPIYIMSAEEDVCYKNCYTFDKWLDKKNHPHQSYYLKKDETEKLYHCFNVIRPDLDCSKKMNIAMINYFKSL